MRVFALAAVMVIAPIAVAQPARGVVPSGAAATRSVARYLVLERELQGALESRDVEAVKRRTAGDFEQRGAAGPDAIDRDQWLRREAARRGPSRVRDLAVRDEGEVSVVSFLLDDTRGPRTRFVVDIWRGDTLLVRYASLAPEAPPAPRRPTGRE